MAEKEATRNAYGRALLALGAENPDVVVLDADLSKSTKTADFGKKYPERFFNMGIAEQNLIGTAAGLAAAGKIPFASTFAVFATGRAFEQIRNSVAYPKLNVKIAATHAGITVGEDGGSHQAVEDVAIMRALPNMTVLVPADGTETRQMILAAARYDGPVYIRMGRLDVPVLYDDSYRFQIGRANVLRRGRDAAVMANGVMVAPALEAAEELAREGLDISVVNVSTVKPLDVDTIVRVAQGVGAIVSAEEHNVIGGLGSAIAEALAEHHPLPLERVGLKDVFGESGRPQELLEKFGLTRKDIVAALRKALSRKH
ncbi:Transketolase C-terminal/Pyruvate-ferredoxin oxidoreductase domain II [Acididesulfobacillus acetoxydans]|uniref:Transketolase C-terminal/Pyruvate-ferredoxin oxidoreductase domain II n=1 Tax=Acididesulfobacillus acetoxydans TaxID=1561005 RepID=A0A8S0VVK4_9FIRM|nr:transketolase family protein [Acididesulfobacillus acetoxydans]CAA7599703.1 Transketolase C-terminal/Pyruvate-ferredoxin oxidoreductase domain II [Acididesulfobacillus acetoxydans]CEJ06255.1 Transketolase-like protein 2 [Acididesulfobacillus acetoxydans]